MSIRERLQVQADAHPERSDTQLALAQLLLREQEPALALQYAEAAIAAQADYSAAYLCAGQAAMALDQRAAARDWYQRGLSVAQANGDKQIERQIGVFLKRLIPKP